MVDKPSKYQLKVLRRLLDGERLVAPRRYTREGRCIGLGIHRFPDKTAVTLTTCMCMLQKGLVRFVDTKEMGRWGYTGSSEVEPTDYSWSLKEKL